MMWSLVYLSVLLVPCILWTIVLHSRISRDTRRLIWGILISILVMILVVVVVPILAVLWMQLI